MARIEDLQLHEEPVEPSPSWDDLPDQYRARFPILQPATFRFQLPDDLSRVFRPRIVELTYRDEEGREQKRLEERVEAIFTQYPLLILSPGGLRNGEPFWWRCSNVERWRNRKHTVKASDLDLLLQGLGEEFHPGFGNNAAYIDALVKYGGRSFLVDVDITWWCSDTREIDVRDQAGGIVRLSGVYGNGKRRTTRQVKKDPDGNYPATIPVRFKAPDPQSGKLVTYTAVVGGFNTLSRFRS